MRSSLPCVAALLAAVFAPSMARPAHAHPGWGIVVDGGGRVFFVDLFHCEGSVWRIDPDGRLDAVLTGRHSHDLVLDADGSLLGTHLAYVGAGNQWISRLWRLDREGRESIVIPPTNEGTRFWGDQFLVDRGGDVVFPFGPRLFVRHPDGTTTPLAGGEARGHRDGRGGEARFTTLGGMAWGSPGEFFIADGGTIRKVTLDGTVTTVARGLLDDRPSRSPLLRPDRLFGLARDEDGSLFVADHGNRRVVKVGQGGRIEVVLRAESPWAPTGVAVAGGDLFVLECGQEISGRFLGPRVRKRSADGRISTLATVRE